MATATGREGEEGEEGTRCLQCMRGEGQRDIDVCFARLHVCHSFIAFTTMQCHTDIMDSYTDAGIRSSSETIV